jgi:ubiquinone/menaquinone biosynthesis C-methylase UbiE
VPANDIIGRNAFPGEEFFSFLAPSDSVLDLGCGTGELSLFLIQNRFKVVGVDINQEAIEKNRASKEGEYLVADIRNGLPFKDESFDAITISFVLVNIVPHEERQKVVAELYRVLRKGGIIWVNEGLISEDYQRRYELCQPFLKEERDFFVFKEGTSSSSIKTKAELEVAIQDQKVARIAHHFTEMELRVLFERFSLSYEESKSTASPHSKSEIKMIIAVYQKPFPSKELHG